jgi:hypothetical protein
MATSIARPNRRLRRLALLAALAVAVAAPATAQSASYGWPVKPFDRQHPIRGFFGDPRVGESAHGESKSFHFGVDISAPDGTPVSATASGPVVWEPERPQTVSIRTADGGVFAYWHIVPAVRDGSYAHAYRTVLGHIARGWEHVHFAEFRDGRYLNPLRDGALAPYRDTTTPKVHTFSFERNGKAIGRARLSGRFDLVAEVRDETPLLVPGRWSHKPVVPAVVRWRLVGRRGRASSWQTAFDVSMTIPAAGLFDSVYARWTRQNHPWNIGRYRVALAHGWDSRVWADGGYRLEVYVADTRGNHSVSSVPFRVDNGNPGV